MEMPRVHELDGKTKGSLVHYLVISFIEIQEDRVLFFAANSKIVTTSGVRRPIR